MRDLIRARLSQLRQQRTRLEQDLEVLNANLNATAGGIEVLEELLRDGEVPVVTMEQLQTAIQAGTDIAPVDAPQEPHREVSG